MWSFQGSSLVFGLKISKGCNINNFTKFPGVEFSFRNFQGNREKPKQFHAFFPKKVCPQPPIPPPPVWYFSSGKSHSKTIDLNWSYEVLAKKEALTISPVGHLHHSSFPCVLSLSSVFRRFTHLYCDSSSLGRGPSTNGK